MDQQNIKKIPYLKDLVIAEVVKITNFGAYCKLIEYNNVDAFLPIKEVSSGWIKNIHIFIHNNQKLVCRVIFFDKQKNTIDISLKKVTPKESKEKIKEYNLEKRSENLFIQAINKSQNQQHKDELISAAISEFKSFTNFIYNANNNTKEYSASALPKKFKEVVAKLVKANKKEKKYPVSYILTMLTYNTLSGISELTSILLYLQNQDIIVSYISAPKYRLIAYGKNYLEAEEKIKHAVNGAKERLKNGVFEIEKEKLKKQKENIIDELND
ncbi:MAG: S1 RNA-binding domain-containing protein [Candidatus Marsarchaeota archaeon]|jgi:translation initiation factor 2 subunit 1|nr:S1 RNA-binding domain-containing protein [Candidatus Marsarchaeota archaeon]